MCALPAGCLLGSSEMLGFLSGSHAFRSYSSRSHACPKALARGQIWRLVTPVMLLTEDRVPDVTETRKVLSKTDICLLS